MWTFYYNSIQYINFQGVKCGISKSRGGKYYNLVEFVCKYFLLIFKGEYEIFPSYYYIIIYSYNLRKIYKRTLNLLRV